MPLVRFWRLWLPACNDFDHQMILTWRKGSRRCGYAAGGPVKVMDRDRRKWGGKPLYGLDEYLNRLGTQTIQGPGLAEVVAALREHGICTVNKRIVGDRLDLIGQRFAKGTQR